MRDGGRLTDPTDKPAHPVATVPLLEGQGNTVDSFGAVFRDRITERALLFARGSGPLARGGSAPRGSRAPGRRLRLRRAQRLALAARASASFPAFEPTFCPAKATGEAPDPGTHASFEGSRWAVDGGLVTNKPLDPALDAIGEQSAAEQVRGSCSTSSSTYTRSRRGRRGPSRSPTASRSTTTSAARDDRLDPVGRALHRRPLNVPFAIHPNRPDPSQCLTRHTPGGRPIA